jgi:DNA polymerase-3 subunit delta'
MNSGVVHPAFAGVVGQDHAVAYLSRALASDRLAHGLVFAGPEGVGKALVARVLASIFLADRADDPESIDKGRALIEAGTHPDFHPVTRDLVRQLEGSERSKAAELSVKVVRAFVVEPAGKRSGLGRGKVFCIVDAAYMNAAAQNSLLKTLEEPPGRALIILLTDQPGSLLPTIRSRCQTVFFNPLSIDDATTLVVSNGGDPSLARSAAELAGGSPGIALRYLAEGVVLDAKRWFDLVERGTSEEIATFLRASADTLAERAMERDPDASKDDATRTVIVRWLALAAERLRLRLASSPAPASVCDRIDAIRRAEILLDARVTIPLTLRQLGVAIASAG